MSRAIKFKNNDYVDSSSVTHGRTMLSVILDTLLGKKVPSWKDVSWSGNNTGGRITTNIPLTGKLVNLTFKSPSNDYHYCYCTSYWVGGNNYLIANMYGVTQYITANSNDSTGFNLSIPTTIKLHSIQYLDI